LTQIFNKTIKSLPSKQTLEKAEYEACVIKDFDINGINLSGYVFIDCVFEGCNLSLCKLSQTAFRNVQFNGCKLLGLRWEDCHTFLFSVNFEKSNLDMGNFYGMKLKKTNFKECSIREVDFTDADLSDSLFEACDFTNAVFDQSNLSNSDFSTSNQYVINPSNNIMKNAKFSWPAAKGLLLEFGIKVE